MIKQWLNQRRFDKQCAALANSPLAAHYQPPEIGDKWFAEAELFVLDFETTGLSPQNNQVLSAGWTSIRRGRMQWRDCDHYLIQHTQAIPEASVAIHHITEQEAAQGQPIESVLPTLLEQLSGKVLVAHFADIEVGFLQQLVQKHYGISLPLVVIDTLQLAFFMKYKHAVHVPQNALNLFTLRAQYGLPRYKAHNARSDAIAAAELLLVLVEELGGQWQVSLAELLKKSR
ncbi:MAG: DNA polymerase III subunit epsilon [Gammaproteobacteria bacterium]|nr:MAG: DNA polymerase III subunit epsilon [Gammaproteobacteria bacterium]